MPIYIANITIHHIGIFWRIAISRYLLNYWRSTFTILWAACGQLWQAKITSTHSHRRAQQVWNSLTTTHVAAAAALVASWHDASVDPGWEISGTWGLRSACTAAASPIPVSPSHLRTAYVFLVLRFRLLGHVIVRRRQCNTRSSDRRQLKVAPVFRIANIGNIVILRKNGSYITIFWKTWIGPCLLILNSVDRNL